MKLRAFLAGAAFALALTPPAFAAVDIDAGVRELGRSWLTANEGIGLSIGIYDGGERRFYNFGATRLDGNQAPTQETIYEIGAIGKTITGQLLARAIIEGRASLADDVARYLDAPYPNLANGGERVRLEHLAYMNSQLSDNIPDLTQVRLVQGEPIARTRMRVIEEYTRGDFLRQLQRVAPRATPGGNPAQSNVSSMLLGVVLEKLHGKTFGEILASEIEKPLRMGSGTHPPTRLLAQGHTQENEPLPPFFAPMSYAATSLRYSTEDLLKYASWQVVERDASVKLAHQPGWFTPDRREAVAFFWISGDSPHGRRLYFPGSTFGFTGVCELYPDAQVAVVLLANKAADGAQESLRALSAKIVALARPVASP
jgi:CubicO group peptidase (beta-lactamase class C family)